MSDAAPAPRLTELTTCGGCAAKWGASLLGDLLAGVTTGAPPSASWWDRHRSTTPPWCD